MNLALQIIQILSLIFVSVALVYYFSTDSSLKVKKDGGTDTFLPKQKLHFSFKSGFYTEAIRLEIANPKDSSCAIYYTIDGSKPTNNSLKYVEPFWIDFSNPVPNEEKARKHRSSVVRSIAYCDRESVSEIKTAVFFIESMISAKYPYPILSIVMEPEALIGSDTTELKVHLDIIENNGVVGMNQYAGLRVLRDSIIEGNMGSLHVTSSKKYGTRYFEYPIFKSDNKPKYQAFGLELILNSSELIENEVRKLETVLAKHNLYAVYINGGYYGIYKSLY
jgi:hypothetical protein